MNRNTLNYCLAVGTMLPIIVIGWFVFFDGAKFVKTSDVQNFDPNNSPESEYVVPPLERDYVNEQFRFTLKLPEGFTVGELLQDTGGKAIILQNAQGEGIQILVTPFPEELTELTAARIRSEIPDMQVSNEEVVEIGENHRGVAFISDNAAFEGGSREVWFVFQGNLYQISTHARLDSLMQEIFATWQYY